MKSPIPFVIAAVVLMVGAALKQGQWSERWGEFPELKQFGERIKKVPMDIGDWQGKDLVGMDERTMTAAGAVAALSREYTNRNVKDWTVRVHIVCGRMQDVFFHTPDRCYPAHGFDEKKKPVSQTVKYGPQDKFEAEFMTATYLKNDRLASSELRIYWNWSADGNWEAPETPKLKYAGQHALYKLYLESNAHEGRGGVNDTPSIELAKVLLPVLTSAFFPDSDALKSLNKAYEHSNDGMKHEPESAIDENADKINPDKINPDK